MKIKDNQFILLIIFLIFGALATIQIRSFVGMQRQSAETLDLNRLKGQLDEKIKLGNSYKLQISKLENEKEAYLASNNNISNVASKNELDHLKLISGFTDVIGDGVIISLNDAEIAGSDRLDDYIIHDIDILRTINELRLAGALAISINNERIISTSEQLCSGPTVKINNNRYAVPFEIKAIGDANKLYNAMENSIYLKEMLEYRKRVVIKQEKDIVIPKFSNDIKGLLSRLEVVDNESKNNK